MGRKALQLEEAVQKDTRANTVPFSPELAGELTKTYTDISSFIQIMAATTQQERMDIEKKKQGLNHKAKMAKFWTDSLFLFGWIITVGAKLKGVDAVV